MSFYNNKENSKGYNKDFLREIEEKKDFIIGMKIDYIINFIINRIEMTGLEKYLSSLVFKKTKEYGGKERLVVLPEFNKNNLKKTNLNLSRDYIINEIFNSNVILSDFSSDILNNIFIEGEDIEILFNQEVDYKKQIFDKMLPLSYKTKIEKEMILDEVGELSKKSSKNSPRL